MMDSEVDDQAIKSRDLLVAFESKPLHPWPKSYDDVYLYLVTTLLENLIQ